MAAYCIPTNIGFIISLCVMMFFLKTIIYTYMSTQVASHTPLPNIGGEANTPVTQPTHPPEVIPRPMLRPSRSQQENKISHSHNSWVYGQDETDRRGVVTRDTNTYRHTDSSRHYINLNSNALHHDYGDVYSVTQDFQSHVGREYRHGHQQATNTLWRAAPWADGSTNYWRGDSPHRGHYRRYH